MRKTLALTTILCLGTGLIATVPVKAQETNTLAQNHNIAPTKLLKLARQGRFKSQGIPSYSSLNSAIKSEKVTAKSLVRAAIQENRLPETALQDRGYLNALDNHLKSGGCGSL